MPKISFLIFLFSAAVVSAQDSPMRAAPGEAPPPQGWSRENPPYGGIHLPPKKTPKPRLKMIPGKEAPTPDKTPPEK